MPLRAQNVLKTGRSLSMEPGPALLEYPCSVHEVGDLALYHLPTCTDDLTCSDLCLNQYPLTWGLKRKCSKIVFLFW